jgi:hypothetical protein
MGTLNPNALAAWIFGASLGYCLGDAHGCAMGLAITSGLTFVVSLFTKD